MIRVRKQSPTTYCQLGNCAGATSKMNWINQGLIHIYDIPYYKAEVDITQECVPVGCVLPAHYRIWRLPNRDPPGQRPPGQRPPGQRPPWMETPLDGDPTGQRPLPWMETPLDRDRDPPWTDRHLWKHNLLKLRLRAVKMGEGRSKMKDWNHRHHKDPFSEKYTRKIKCNHVCIFKFLTCFPKTDHHKMWWSVLLNWNNRLAQYWISKIQT